MSGRLLTPSTITAWLDCEHYLRLRGEVAAGLREGPGFRFGEMAQLLLDKGLAHEAAVLAEYEAAGRDVLAVPARGDREPFAAWAARVGPVLDEGHDVLYQMPFVHDGIRGIADFLERTVAADGAATYEPVDAKLARAAAKPGHVLQLCFYAEAIAARTGRVPERVHIALGSGRGETIRVAEVAAYWRRLKGAVTSAVVDPPTDSVPEPCAHCAFCEFQHVCEDEWRADDSLVFVAGLRGSDRALLQVAGVDTLADLAGLGTDVDGVPADRLARVVRQARLQVLAREAPADSPQPFELLTDADTAADAVADEAVGEAVDGDSLEGIDGPAATLVGFAALPEPDEGDMVLDFEGHPFWRADTGLFFLFGWIERDDDGAWAYRTLWAHDLTEEATATQALVEYIRDRRARFPGMHVYHYNHTERTALTRLAADHGVAELDLEDLVATGVFVDLYPVVTGAVQVGVESYGLKHVERLTGFERSHDIDRGAGAVVEYEHWTTDHDPVRLDRIARYNEDDVRATAAVRDWLVAHRPPDLPWRPAVLDPQPGDPELDARIEALHAHGPGTPEHLMGDLLGYWRRERRVVAADCLRLSMAPTDEQRDSPSVITDLTFQRIEPRVSAKTGRTLTSPAAVFTFPPQPVDPDIRPGSKLIHALAENHWGFYELDAIDPEVGVVRLIWTQEAADAGVYPPSLVHWVVFDESAKLAALSDLADDLLAGNTDRVGHAILRRDRPAFTPGHGPADGRLVGQYPEICAWVPHLERSYLPVQGPPGTGKTFTGAHVIHTLVRRKKRVGITAMSHNAIDNLLQAVADRFAAEGDGLRAVHKGGSGRVAGVAVKQDNKACAAGPFDVVAGTPWLFASPAMREHPVDVLIVDEAGQLGLADTLAATASAELVVLLGDPQQLPQVAQAVHPDGAGVSALEHLLGPDAHTFPPDAGVLLDVTWRMHPDICRFVSEVMYDGRLTSHPDCAGQATAAGTGLRWIRAEHTGRSTASPEEADLVAATITGLLGSDWTDRHGVTRPITAEDVIVVTPYNDQRRLITDILTADPLTAGVEVGTVDKFQGREAAVVLFSMATSSAEFMPRDADFLFSKNRLNVAVSRARCLAYLICTDALLDTRARDVDQMTLLSAICSFVEHADPATPTTSPSPG